MDLRRLGVLAHWNDGTGVKRVFERRLLKLRDSLPAIGFPLKGILRRYHAAARPAWFSEAAE